MKWLPVTVMAKKVSTGYTMPAALNGPGSVRSQNTPRMTVQLKCRLGIAADVL